MSIETRKLNLINWLSRLNDEKMISRIEKLQQQESDWWDKLPESVQESINIGLSQAEKGEVIPHEEVMKEVKAKYGL